MIKKIREVLINKNKNDERGFTLIELMVVVVILGILAAVIIPRVATSRATANQNAENANISILQSAVERYQAETGNWPSDDLSDLEDDGYVTDIPASPLGGTYQLDDEHKVVNSNDD